MLLSVSGIEPLSLTFAVAGESVAVGRSSLLTATLAVAGEPTVLKISQPCEASAKDPSEMAAFLIPIDQLLKMKPRNMVYQFDGHKSVMTLINSADEWPHTWVLRKVEFRNASGSDSKQAQFGRSPASADSAQPIVLEF